MRDVDRPIRVSCRLGADLTPIDSWANPQAESEEGRFESSGVGGLGDLASMEDMLENEQITRDHGGARGTG